jgi:predicted nucleotidyltransferase component of viral defense system
MNTSADYYTEKLYPLQDGVLHLVKELKIPFYLTGGTALSRHYFQHRYSDDLDLFVNSDASYGNYVLAFYNELAKQEKAKLFAIDHDKLRRGEYHSQFFLKKDAGGKEIFLKIDLINDSAVHYGELIENPLLGKVDSLENILTNKISAIFRYEPKDIFDLRVIALHMSFEWKDIIRKSKVKEAAVDPIVIYDIIKSFPAGELDAVNSAAAINKKRFLADLSVIARDIFEGRNNTLCG